MNVGDKVYLVCVHSCNMGIKAALVETAPSRDPFPRVGVRYNIAPMGANRITCSMKEELTRVAESPDAARELMRAQIQKAKNEALAEVARLDAIDVSAVEIQDL